MFQKYANVEAILDVKTTQDRLEYNPNFELGDNFEKFARAVESKDETGYLYVRARAISSRTNKNNDSWPTKELKKAYKSFLGKPIFVDHNNDDPKRTRGVVIDARLHEEDIEKLASKGDDYYKNNPDPKHLPPVWIEVLMEIDAKTFPKLARAIKKGDIDAVSMGANVAWTECNICGNKAESQDLYCTHISSKGAEFEIIKEGKKERKKAYEHCFFGSTGGFFELSNVFDPADETALHLENSNQKLANQELQEVIKKVAKERLILAKTCPHCKGTNTDKVLKEAWDGDNFYSCLDCKKNYRFKEAGIYDQEQDLPLGEGDEYELPQAQHKDPYLDQYYRAPEDDRVKMWVIEQLQNLGFSPEDASRYAETLRGNTYGEFMKLVDRGWPPDLALRVVSNIKQAVPMDTMKPVNQEYERQLNYIPQSDQVTAPESVNTLRDDPLCPNCHSDSLQADPDGTMKCPSCSYISPPEGLDNPDLSMHKKVMEEQEQQQSPVNHEEEQVRIVPNEQAMEPMQQIEPISPIKSHNSQEGINRMKWSTVYNGTVVETTINNSEGIGTKAFKKLRELGLTAKVTYPSGEELNIPFDAPAKGMVLTLKAQNEGNYESPGDIPITIESNTKDIDSVLEIIHTGAAIPSVKKIINPHIKTKTDDPANPKVVSDQQAPVTSKNNEEKMELKESDKKTVKTEEELPDGAVKRTEEVIETEEEETKKSSVDVEKKLLTVFALADEYVEAGLVPKEEKLALVAKLEEESLEVLEGRKASLAMVKDAGFHKPVSKTASLPRIPNLASFNLEAAEEEIPFEAIFYS